MYLSEYLFQSIIHSLYYDGIYLTQLPDTGLTAISTTELNIATAGAMKAAGWDNGQPCVTDVLATGPAPHVDVTQKDGLNATFSLSLDIKCKKNSSSTEFDHVFTVVTKEIKINAAVSHFTLKFNLIFYPFCRS